MSTEAPRNEEGFSEDELWTALDGQVGSERASTLMELTDMVNQRGDFEHALSLADAAVEAAKDADNELVLAKAYITRGAALFSLERYEESAAAHLDGAHLFERYESAGDTSHAYFNASWSLEAAGIFDRSLECIDTSLAAAQQEGDEARIARVNVQRADVLEKLGGRGDEVMQALSAARQAYRSLADSNSVMRIDNRVADLFADAGDYKAAMSLLSDCLAVAESIDEGKASYYAYRLAYVQRRQGLYREALEMLQRPLAFNLETDAIRPLGSVYFEMALNHARLDEMDEAFAAMKKARAHYDTTGFDEGIRDCDESRASWLHNARRFNEAIELNRLLMETNEGWQQFNARARLADNYRCANDLEHALEFSTPLGGVEDTLVGGGMWFWRECVRAMTLESLDREEEAQAIAITCLDMDMSNASAFVQARFHEMRGDAKLADDNEDGAHADWARAVAFYLVADLPGDAKRLSAEFLPSSGEAEAQ